MKTCHENVSNCQFPDVRLSQSDSLSDQVKGQVSNIYAGAAYTSGTTTNKKLIVWHTIVQ